MHSSFLVLACVSFASYGDVLANSPSLAELKTWQSNAQSARIGAPNSLMALAALFKALDPSDSWRTATNVASCDVKISSHKATSSLRWVLPGHERRKEAAFSVSWSRRQSLGFAAATFSGLALNSPARALDGQDGAVLRGKDANANYYFPTAKYRYLPRIQRGYIAASILALPALEQEDWEGVQEACERLRNTVPAMTLFTDAVEGQRGMKKSKKTPTQKVMTKAAEACKVAVADLDSAVDKRNAKKAKAAIEVFATNINLYREAAQINDESGGVLDPDEFKYESGTQGDGILPIFQGGGSGLSFSKEELYSLKKSSK